ncbi:DUF1499 domain-containing protein [Cognaticolwellia beringensis]|nr:DUF1499 domain-containing protein [Cognaticolwellia beringensis]
MLINTITNVCKAVVIPLLLGFPIAVIAYRMELWPMGVSFKIIKYTGYASIAVLAVSILIGLFTLFKKQYPLAKRCAFIAILSAIPAIGLSMQASKAKSLPFLHQVTTDTVNLPKFNAIIALRGDNSNPLAYDQEKLAPLQLAAYPKLKPILSQLDKDQAFAKALEVALSLGWEVVAKNEQQGIIEAVDTSALWAFKDDIAIRVQALGVSSKIDLRSISRIGGTDLGANAARVEKFITTFSDK